MVGWAGTGRPREYRTSAEKHLTPAFSTQRIEAISTRTGLSRHVLSDSRVAIEQGFYFTTIEAPSPFELDPDEMASYDAALQSYRSRSAASGVAARARACRKPCRRTGRSSPIEPEPTPGKHCRFSVS